MASIYTVGHSTRSAEAFRAVLRAHGIERLVDVRRYPGSRRHPHFAGDALRAFLAEFGIEYVHEPAMGGRRRPREDSPHTAWRVAGFRAYADHMETDEFRAALDRLIESARSARTAIMCAEIVPWRCHRQLIADALVSRGFRVVHLIDEARSQEHELNDAARVRPDGTLLYRAPADEQRDLEL